MKQTVEALVDDKGNVRLIEPIAVKGVRRALLTVLDELPVNLDETLYAAEKSFGEDWLRKEDASGGFLGDAP
jgi:hypothetical protein